MDNRLKNALGGRPNSEFLYDPDGKLVVSRQWSSPSELRRDLEERVGRVDKPTQVADLDMPRMESPKAAPTGIVPRISLPGQMTPVVLKPEEGGREPFYVKLRAEMDNNYQQTGIGKLYLGFFLDPIHKVHWNNLADPIVFEVEDENGVFVVGAPGKGPDVEEKADADPREFLVDIGADFAADESATPQFKLTVKYFACDDAETFCKPVTQTYTVVLQRDRNGGSRRAGGGGRGPGGGGGRGPGSRGFGGPGGSGPGGGGPGGRPR